MVVTYLKEIWVILQELAPWLFLGAIIATALKFSLPENFITSHLGKPNLMSVFKSAFFGLPMPLCSCGVIPAAIGLKKAGASNGAVVSFMISTPQTGADSLLLVASFLGWPLAIYMMVTTFLTGLIGGVLVYWFAPSKQAAPVESVPQAQDTLSTESKESKWRKYTRYALDEIIGGIYKYILAGLFIAALINLVIPAQSLSKITMLQGIWGILGVLAIAIPLYVCTNGSVPIAASLVASGLPAGSAMVFLMAGSATNVATIGSVFRVLGHRVTFLYLGTIVIGSIVFALLFQQLWGNITLSHVAAHREHAASPFQQVPGVLSALFLVFLILRWALLDLRAWLRKIRFSSPQEALQEEILKVDGMTCTNCAARIKRDLELVPGVTRVEINLENGIAKMWGKNLDQAILAETVCKAGYTVRGKDCV
jgi:hypothetical protein